jgi:hypothetical protein
MAIEPIPTVQSIDPSQWHPQERHLLYHFVSFPRMANAVITEPGPLQGWFAGALWRHDS